MTIEAVSTQALEASRLVRQDTGVQREQDRQINEDAHRAETERDIARSSDANRGRTLDISA